MNDKKRLDDTITGISVQDILDEISAEHVSAEEELSVDEILSEFSDYRKNDKDNNVLHAEPAILKASEKIPSENNTKEEKKAKIIEATPEVNKKSDSPNEKITVPQFEEAKEEEIERDLPIKKKERKSKFTETFDTFTRSELFEEKGTAEPVELRSVDEIISINAKIAKNLGLRATILFILSVFVCYLAFAEPLGIYLPKIISYLEHPFRYLFLSAFFEICAMFLSVDIISRGLARLFKLRPNVESAVAFSAFATLIHVISIMAFPHWMGWLPYSSITVLNLFFAIYGKWLNARALCKVGKTVKSAKSPGAVYVESIYGQNYIIKQNADDSKPFISHIDDKDASYTFWRYLSPVVIVATVVFAFVASFGSGAPSQFFWALAGISAVSTPFFTMLSFSLPFFVSSKRLSLVGTAISGWYSATNLSKKSNIVACDNDIFPKGAVVLHGLKILGDFSLEKTVCYIASVIAETNSGLSDVFCDLLKSRYGTKTEVSNLTYHETGGIEAEVSGENVLIGTAGFMLRSGIRLDSGTGTQNAVFIAINRTPAGIFNINYKANPDVERALHMLVKKKVPVILAVRDFNMLPMMIERTFGLRDGVLEYPEIEQRLDLSSKDQFVTGDAVAIITRGGIYPMASAILMAKKLRRITIRNILLTTAASLIGMLLMFYLTFMQRPGLVPPHTLFVYMILWYISTYMLSLKVKR